MPKAYEQVADRLRQLIVTEELARGERLPNELQLADDFGVSRAPPCGRRSACSLRRA